MHGSWRRCLEGLARRDDNDDGTTVKQSTQISTQSAELPPMPPLPQLIKLEASDSISQPSEVLVPSPSNLFPSHSNFIFSQKASNLKRYRTHEYLH